MGKPEMYNAHVHIFTLDHVPNKFARGMFKPVSGWVTIKLIKRIARWSDGWQKRRKAFMLRNPWYNTYILRVLLWVIQWVSKRLGIGTKMTLPSKDTKEMIAKYLRLLNFSYDASSNSVYDQLVVFQRLKNYYPENTHFVALTMDMEYMGGGAPTKNYADQLNKIEEIANDDDSLLPFLCVDPRRLENDWTLSNFFERLNTGLYKGIKLYPALGYYPFDWRLLPIYEKALELNLPIMTHCSHGPVYSRRSYDKNIHGTHPFSGMSIGKRVYKGSHIENFTVHFTDPVNYLVITNPKYLKHYLSKVDTGSFTDNEKSIWDNYIIKQYGEDFDEERLSKFEKLKICLAHWGGGEEWDRYLEDYDPNIEGQVNPFTDDLRIAENHKKVWCTYSWFSLIRGMLLEEKWNFYSDISFTLHQEKYLNVLKVNLKDEQIRKRVLFGTDYYVVSHKETEREFSIDVRGELSEEDWKAVSLDNPTAYLN